jgi:citrate synthase
LTLRADNELNPSTFAARVTAATKADLHGCITAALAALAGPLHGDTRSRSIGCSMSLHRPMA